MVVPDLTNPLFPPIVRGIEDLLGASRLHGLIVNTDNDPAARGRSRVARVPEVEGFIVATARADHPLWTAARPGQPIVLVNRRSTTSSCPR